MKTLVLGDIHGKLIWKDILTFEQPDFVIFLGDYVDSHGDESVEQQINNLKDILAYKRDNWDTTVLLRGNHCAQYGFGTGDCSSYRNQTQLLFPREEYKECTQWVYVRDKVIFSHAGVSKVWMERNGLNSIEDVINIPSDDYHKFMFTPSKFSDYYGISPTQPPTWIRPWVLSECAIDGYTQVVGHSPINNIQATEMDNGENIWLCDGLDIPQYLIIDDGQFIPKTFENESKLQETE